jgi:hypothetical protein
MACSGFRVRAGLWAYKISAAANDGLCRICCIRPEVECDARHVWRRTGCIWLVAVYGYVLNDITDIEEDQRAVRRNRMARSELRG